MFITLPLRGVFTQRMGGKPKYFTSVLIITRYYSRFFVI